MGKILSSSVSTAFETQLQYKLPWKQMAVLINMYTRLAAVISGTPFMQHGNNTAQRFLTLRVSQERTPNRKCTGLSHRKTNFHTLVHYKWRNTMIDFWGSMRWIKGKKMIFPDCNNISFLPFEFYATSISSCAACFLCHCPWKYLKWLSILKSTFCGISRYIQKAVITKKR